MSNNDRWLTQYGDYEFLPGPNTTPEQAKAMNDRMRELRRTRPRITEADPPDAAELPDRFGWDTGELVLRSSPVMTDEEIAAWNAEQRAAGLARLAAKGIKPKDGE
jgi:hypothetical protein